MSHTFNYPGFFSTWHQSDKQYGISENTDAWIRTVSRENAAQAVEDERCVPVIPVDFVIHDEAHLFCDSEKCPCHDMSLLESEQAFDTLEAQVLDGLLTVSEAQRLFWGDQV